MKEEIKEGMSNLKKGVIGLLGTLVAGVGTFVTTQFNTLLGIEEESETPTEIVVPVENTQQQINPNQVAEVITDPFCHVTRQKRQCVKQIRRDNSQQ